MCKVFELKAESLQLVFICFGRLLPFRQNGFQHLPVFEQGIIDVAYKTAVTSF